MRFSSELSTLQWCRQLSDRPISPLSRLPWRGSITFAHELPALKNRGNYEANWKTYWWDTVLYRYACYLISRTGTPAGTTHSPMGQTLNVGVRARGSARSWLTWTDRLSQATIVRPVKLSVKIVLITGVTNRLTSHRCVENRHKYQQGQVPRHFEVKLKYWAL